MTIKSSVPMLKRAGNEIMRAHKSLRIPLANSTSLSSLAILKIRKTRRRLGLTAPSFALNSSSTTSVERNQIVHNPVFNVAFIYILSLHKMYFSGLYFLFFVSVFFVNKAILYSPIQCIKSIPGGRRYFVNFG